MKKINERIAKIFIIEVERTLEIIKDKEDKAETLEKRMNGRSVVQSH